MLRNYQLSYLKSGWDLNSNLRGGMRECYQCASVALFYLEKGNLDILSQNKLLHNMFLVKNIFEEIISLLACAQALFNPF